MGAAPGELKLSGWVIRAEGVSFGHAVELLQNENAKRVSEKLRQYGGASEAARLIEQFSQNATATG